MDHTRLTHFSIREIESATIGWMGKFKPARPKGKKVPGKPGAVPCVVFLISAMVLLSLLFYLVMSSSSK
jgi:hypothetical protein